VCRERNGVSDCLKLLGSAMEEEFEEGTTRTSKRLYTEILTQVAREERLCREAGKAVGFR
jgi:hypothetical protein